MSLDASDNTDRESSPTMDDVLRALASPRRRLVLQELHRSPTGMGFDRLALAVTARETHRRDRSVDLGTVRMTLHHVHLPVLRSAGLLTVDDDGAVRPSRTGLLETLFHQLRNQFSTAATDGGARTDDSANA